MSDDGASITSPDELLSSEDLAHWNNLSGIGTGRAGISSLDYLPHNETVSKGPQKAEIQLR